MNSITTGLALDAGELRIPSTTLTDLSRYTLAQTELLCPSTRLPHVFDQGTPETEDDIAAHLTVPRWLVLKDEVELVRESCANPVPESCGNGVVDGGEDCDTGIPLGEPGACPAVTVAMDEDFDGDGEFNPGGGVDQNVTYEVLSAIGLACADRGYRPFLLHPVTGPEATANPETFSTYFRYLCLQSWDDTQGKTVYRCGKGMLAAGVSGYAVRDGTLSARPIYLSELSWGGNVWNRHWQFREHHIGSIPEPIAAGQQIGYALDAAWGLNPRETHGGGGSKEPDYLAALALKTATNRTGVVVSPYNRANATGGLSFESSELNQCEPGYHTYPDLASTGALEQGMLLNLSVAGWYQDACGWAHDWALPVLPTQQVGGCQVFDIGAGPLQTRMGLNLGDATARRCPSFATCAPGTSCCVGRFAAGSGYTCAVKSDTTLQCWGYNGYGQLGQVGAGSSIAQPALESADGPPLTGVLDVATGSVHTCARRKDGSLWCWGTNFYGQLGDGTYVEKAYPVQVTGLGTSSAVEQVVATVYHTCARRTDGSLYCWGYNATGQLGDGTTVRRTLPVLVTALGTTVADVAANYAHTCARRQDGSLWCWGANTYGQLGDGTTLDRWSPVPVTALGSAVSEVRAGSYHTCARKIDGSVACWGRNNYGQLGDGTTTDSLGPIAVPTLGNAVAELAVGSHANCALLGDQSLWCWGYGGGYQMGNGAWSDQPTPAPVTALGTTVAEVSLSSHACVRRLDGSLWCWGVNQLAELGDGTVALRSTPVRSVGLSCDCGDGVCSRTEMREGCPADCRQESCGDGRCTGAEDETSCALDCDRPLFAEVATGDRHACARSPDGTLRCWGENAYGQLGGPAPWQSMSPLVVTALGTSTTSIALGGGHSCARLSDGTLWCWGDNYYGQLGDNSTSTRYNGPVRVATLGTNIGQFRTAYAHTCARLTNGRLFCWGSNANGQLGNGTTVRRLTPLRITAVGNSVAEVAVGHYYNVYDSGHTCARRNDGSVACWGDNSAGQLGDGTTMQRLWPVEVTALGTTATQISTRGRHSCALRNDGSLWCWGSNWTGQLGDGTGSNQLLPVRVDALGTAVVSVTTGDLITCALLNDGSQWCWGSNSEGRVGDGTTTNRYSPVPITSMGTTVAEVACSDLHSCARRSDGTIWCWGSNGAGQLGAFGVRGAWSPVAISACGDGVCGLNEAQGGACPADCTTTCGDCVCDGVLEDATSCPADCAPGGLCTPSQCGNARCEADETCSLCPGDCGTCVTTCGKYGCEPGETCSSCAEDCGACAAPACGNASCDAGETCGSCPSDCGACSGTAWGAPSAAISASLQTVTFPLATTVGFAAGTNGTLLKSSDSGASWTALPSGTAATLRALAFLDAQTGLAAGDGGVLLKTTDGGLSWSTLSSGTTASLRAIALLDAQTGFAAGDGGVLLKTSNGGTSWTALTSGTAAALHALRFVDAQTGFAAGDGGVILKTTNGGTSWSMLTSGTPATLRALAFIGPQTGFAAGDNGTIVKTTNGGTSWSTLTSGVHGALHALSFPLGALQGTAVGEGGLVLRTTDGGTTWTQESSGSSDTLLAVTMPADWTMGVAVGASGRVVRRIPPWAPSILYDTEVASLAPPTVLPNTVMSKRVAFAGNNSGWLYALSPTERVPRYSPARLADAMQGRSPVGKLPGDSFNTLYAATASGLGYALNADTGALRWTTDGDSGLAGDQPLGAALVAAPVVSPSRNLAFFATRNLSGAQNRVFAFDAKTGACRWVLNGTCVGSTGALNVGQISGSPVHDAVARMLFITSTSLSGGDTLWAVDAGDATPGTLSWSRNLGDSDASPSFAEATRTSLYVGTNNGRLHRVRAADGVSCWSTTGSGCTAFGGSEQAFCTATDALGTSCAVGSAIASGVVVLWSGSHLGRLLFATADGHLRLLNADGSLVWKTADPIPGASLPLAIPERDSLFVGGSDGQLRELSLSTGAVLASQTVGSGSASVGSPTYDTRALMLYVGTSTGTLFRFNLAP
ncbi:MAG: PQQ-binding-like beta-propeller repeat protein [Proteobacteria bacterium]|nr:PQQ-binding-like beta-propeller repeat protein [Pseudomonadota bacterium]